MEQARGPTLSGLVESDESSVTREKRESVKISGTRDGLKGKRNRNDASLFSPDEKVEFFFVLT